MPTIMRSGDCGNSPKNRLVEDLSVAMAVADSGTVGRLVSVDVSWNVVGVAAYEGLPEVTRALADFGGAALQEVRVARVMSHKRRGAADGVLVADGTRRHFCHVMEFANAKGTVVDRIFSYVVSDMALP